MNWTKTDTKFALVITVCLLILLWLGFTGCTSTRHVQKTEVKTDDSRLTELSDSNKLLKSEVSRLQIENKSLKEGWVIFDPPVVDTGGYKADPKDWLPTIIPNTVEINPEGSIKASGNIKSAHFSSSISERVISTQKKTIDSFKSLKQKTIYITKTITITKNKQTQTSYLSWVIWLLTGFAIGKWGKQIFNYAKSKL